MHCGLLRARARVSERLAIRRIRSNGPGRGEFAGSFISPGGFLSSVSPSCSWRASISCAWGGARNPVSAIPLPAALDRIRSMTCSELSYSAPNDCAALPHDPAVRFSASYRPIPFSFHHAAEETKLPPWDHGRPRLRHGSNCRALATLHSDTCPEQVPSAMTCGNGRWPLLSFIMRPMTRISPMRSG